MNSSRSFRRARGSRPIFAFARLMMIASAVVVLSLTGAKAQVAYNFQSPDQIATSTGCNGTDLKMDCLAANGYGQWTTSSNTTKSHLLSNKLTTSTADDAQSGILSAKSLTFATGESYPTTDAIRAATNLNGNVRYVWMSAATPRKNIYVEGYDPGSAGIDISFSALPGDASIVKAPNPLGGKISLLGTGHTFPTPGFLSENPLDMFDVAMDASFIYIVWVEGTSVNGACTIWATVLNMDGTTKIGPTLVTPTTGTIQAGCRPTVAVDVRHSGTTPAPFDVAYISAVPNGSVCWQQFIPATSTFTGPQTANTAFVDPLTSLSRNWSNPQHARILAASQAGVSPAAQNQRAVYIMADFNTAQNLFLDRIINSTFLATCDYADGVRNCVRPSNCPVENCSSGGTHLFGLKNEPLWAFSNPYEGDHASSTSLTQDFFTEFHCVYRLDRQGTGIATANTPLMIIPGANAASGFCVNGQTSTTFFADPTSNSLGISQYCAAVNQMGIHVHWRSSSDHFYRRDRREFDQNIEESTLVTDVCSIGNTTSTVGISSPTILANQTFTIYSDPTTNTYYTGFGNLVFDNSATLNVGSSTEKGSDFVTAGAFRINGGSTLSDTWTLNFGNGNTWDHYGNNPLDPDHVQSTGHIAMTGGTQTTSTTNVGDYVSAITDPVILNMHGGTNLILGAAGFPTDITATGTKIIFKFEASVPHGTSGTQSGELSLNGNASFTKCQFLSENNSTGDPTLINIGSNGTWNSTTHTGTGDANYDGIYSSASNSTVSFAECYFKAGPISGATVGHAYLELDDPDQSPSALTISNGLLEGWSIKGTQGISPWWPISITYAAFDQIQEFGVDISEGTTISTLGSSISQLYYIDIENNDFLNYNLANHTNPDGIRIEDAPDLIAGSSPSTYEDGLRQDITVASNTFEHKSGPNPGDIRSAIHFHNTTGDIGSNEVTTTLTSGSEYQRGIWNESASATTPEVTWSLICSNTVKGLSNTSAAGISTDFYEGYAKLNISSNNNFGHVSDQHDRCHVIFSTYENNASTGIDARAGSQMDLTGVHHTSDHSLDIAAYNHIDYNHGGGNQIGLVEPSARDTKVFLGNAGPGSGSSWSVWGDNCVYVANTTTYVTLCADAALSGMSGGIGDVSNNFWGGTTFHTGSCSSVFATGTTGISSCPTPPDVSCSGGLPLRDQHGSSNAAMSMPASGDSGMSPCDKMLNIGAGLLNDGDCKGAYDMLKDFMEQCPTYVGGKYNSGVGTTDMFPNLTGAVTCWTAGGTERWPQYLEWLKSVLYLRTDTSWYCHDVYEMLIAEQRNIDARLATIQYVTSTKHCTDDYWGTLYAGGMNGKHKAWFDSLQSDFRMKYGINAWQDSAINADTLAHPFDSTYGTIDDYGLSVLRGQQYASSAHYKDLPATALLEVRVTENPFDATIGLTIDLQREALVTMELRDLLGRTVPLEYGKYQLMHQGTETRTFASGDLPAGTYYLRVSTDLGEVRTLKLVKN